MYQLEPPTAGWVGSYSDRGEQQYIIIAPLNGVAMVVFGNRYSISTTVVMEL